MNNRIPLTDSKQGFSRSEEKKENDLGHSLTLNPNGNGKYEIQSFRLRLHSGLRQSGSAFGAAFNVQAKAWTYPRSSGKSNSKSKIRGSLHSAALRSR